MNDVIRCGEAVGGKFILSLEQKRILRAVLREVREKGEAQLLRVVEGGERFAVVVVALKEAIKRPQKEVAKGIKECGLPCVTAAELLARESEGPLIRGMLTI